MYISFRKEVRKGERCAIWCVLKIHKHYFSNVLRLWVILRDTFPLHLFNITNCANNYYLPLRYYLWLQHKTYFLDYSFLKCYTDYDLLNSLCIQNNFIYGQHLQWFSCFRGNAIVLYHPTIVSLYSNLILLHS